jgi:hypothetical protein
MASQRMPFCSFILIIFAFSTKTYAMNTLFNAKDYDEMLVRIDKFQHNSERLWGKMDAAQMLAHCNEAMKTAVGETKIKRVFIGRILGGWAKKQFLTKPIGKNSPTAKEFVVANKRDFDKEKTELLSYMKRFHEGGEKGTTTHPHGFFGQMTASEWGVLQWKHLDHHLRQFGA